MRAKYYSKIFMRVRFKIEVNFDVFNKVLIIKMSYTKAIKRLQVIRSHVSPNFPKVTDGMSSSI